MFRSARTLESGIGAVVGEELIDLTFAYARYLRETEGGIRAYELARAKIPRDMIGFLEGGERALEAARRSIALVQGLRRREVRAVGRAPGVSLSDIRLLAPIPRPGEFWPPVGTMPSTPRKPTGRCCRRDEAVSRRRCVKVFLGRHRSGRSRRAAARDEGTGLRGRTCDRHRQAGRYLAKENAYDYVAGYTILNDISARDIQLSEAKYGNHLLGKKPGWACAYGAVDRHAGRDRGPYGSPAPALGQR